MTIFVCEDSVDGILTGVYDAWDSKLGHDNVKLTTSSNDNYQLFSTYKDVITDTDKSQKVINTINKRFNYHIKEYIIFALLADDNDKADAVYRVLVNAISNKMGNNVMDDLSNCSIRTVYNLRRSVWNEVHHYYGFVRFRELDNNVLFSKINPKHNILAVICEHFTDRFPKENWIIYDEKRHIAAVHECGHNFMIVSNKIDEELLSESDGERELTDLWKNYFKSIAIEARKNEKCQRNMIPYRFRDNVVEFN